VLGSDYTLGVKGIGIVNACEVLSAFCAASSAAEHASSRIGSIHFSLDPTVRKGLEDFRKWTASIRDPARERFPDQNLSKIPKTVLSK